MDPRPYHFDYRRPRISNPTYLSYHTKDSIYQYSDLLNNSTQIKQYNPEKSEKSNNYAVQKYRERSAKGYGYINEHINMPTHQQLHRMPQSQPISPTSPINQPKQRNSSSDLKNYAKVQIHRYHSKNQLDRNREKSTPSSLSTYGSNSLNLPRLDQNTVYKKQQKAFNIINFDSNEAKNKIQRHPRLTLQDKLREKKALQQRSSIYRFE